MYLLIVEVSQKQAYIFKNKELSRNIENSERIVYVTSPAFFKKLNCNYTDENMVYTGGGHTVLSFDTKEAATGFNRCISRAVLEQYPDMELFTKVIKYDDNLSPGDNLNNLTKELEIKKSIRQSSFHQGTFGIEKIDSKTLTPIMILESSDRESQQEKDNMIPDGFREAYKFEDLGGTKDSSNFIAVVHIDGNSMGARVSKLYKKLDDECGNDFETYRQRVMKFSDAIDKDFKDSYREMSAIVAESIRNGDLEELAVKNNYFPIRKIIISGDDVCFVSEGRIGIECARIFIDKLRSKTNCVDGGSYEACAGIAIVHNKYPFFRAYELAENLCSNAKRYCASLDPDSNGGLLSAMDWHISFGELADDTETARIDYSTADGKQLEIRPYILGGKEDLIAKDKYRKYQIFKKQIAILSKDGFARGKIKNLRAVLKKGNEQTLAYIRFNKIHDITISSYFGIIEEQDIHKVGSGQAETPKVFITTADGKERSILFDAIEMMDTYLPIDGGNTL